MQNFDELRRELERRGKAEELRALAESEDGARLSAMLDTEKLSEAAKSGDSAALQKMLGGVLRTEEGKRLAENIRRMMES